MAKFEYIGNDDRHRVVTESKDDKGHPIRRPLKKGEVVELTPEQAKAFPDRFKPAASSPAAKPAPAAQAQ